jgi:hypothetical protein
MLLRPRCSAASQACVGMSRQLPAVQAQATQETEQQAVQLAKQGLTTANCTYNTAATHYNNSLAFHQRLTSNHAAAPV